MQRRVRLDIFGRVQGVGFRYSAQQRAVALGLHGSVRNRADGGVTAEIEGPEEALEAFISWARQGPPGARVDHVHHRDEAPTGDRGPFHITA